MGRARCGPVSRNLARWRVGRARDRVQAAMTDVYDVRRTFDRIIRCGIACTETVSRALLQSSTVPPLHRDQKGKCTRRYGKIPAQEIAMGDLARAPEGLRAS